MKYLPLLLLLIFMRAAAADVLNPTEIDKRLKALEGVLSGGRSDEFIKRNQEILSDSRKISYSKGIAESCLRIAIALIARGNLEQGDLYLELAEKESYFKNSIIFQGQTNSVYVSMYMAEKLYDKALERLRLTGDTASRYYPTRLVKMARCFAELKQPDSAFVYLRKSVLLIKTRKEKKAQILLSIAYCIMSLEFNKEAQNDSAKYYIKMGQEIAEKTKDNASIATAKAFLGHFYLQRKNTTSAIVSFKTSLKLIQSSKDFYAIMDLYSFLYKAYKLEGNHDQESHYLHLYLSLSNSIKKRNNLSVIVNTLKKDKEESFNDTKGGFVILIIIIGVSIVIVGLLAFQKFRKHKIVVNNIIKEKADLLSSVPKPKTQTDIASIGLLNELAKSKDPYFFDQFDKLYPDFDDKLIHRYPLLSTRDIEFCKYLRMNYDTKKIARLTDTSVRTVESKKYRLRKKLSMSSSEDINLFISNI